jgi:urease accessory protein
MKRTPRIFICVATMLAATSQAAVAHVGVGQTRGLTQGFEHPLGGLDHILAMVMVGVLAAQMSGRARLLVPAAFLTVMVLGGVAGKVGVGLPLVELGIGLSVVVLGAVVALGLRIPEALAMGMVGFFAMFHGYAHGAEMPATGSSIGYGAGFLLATALLHAVGFGLGAALSRMPTAAGAKLIRATGSVASLAGVAIIAGIF